MMSSKYKNIIASFTTALLLLVVGNVVFGSPKAYADPGRLPDNDYNLSEMRGVISTGRVVPATNQRNDFYGPVMWVKIYSDQPVDRTFNITFEGGPQRTATDDDAGPSGANDCPPGKTASNSHHVPETKRQLLFFQGGADGKPGAFKNIIDDFKGDRCFERQITIDSTWWGPAEAESNGRHVVFLQLSMWQRHSDGTGLWNNDRGDMPSHVNGGHDNHPSSGFVLNSNGGIVFGNWGQYLGTDPGEASDSHFLSPTIVAHQAHEFNSYIKGINFPTNQKQRTFKFATSCSASPNNTVWLKWFDDEVTPNNEDTHMVMHVYEKPAGTANWGAPIKTISGMNEQAANSLGLAQNSNWRQKNKTPNNYDSANWGEGFGGRGAPGKAKINMKRGYEYKWTFEASGSHAGWTTHKFGNRIAVWFPFDSAFSNEKDCQPRPAYGCWPPISTNPEMMQRGMGTTVTFGITRLPASSAPPPPSITLVLDNGRTATGTNPQKTPFGGAEILTYTATINGADLSQARQYAMYWPTPAGATAPTLCGATFNVYDLPYFQAVNGAIRAGGDFESTSSDNRFGSKQNGWLASWYNNSGTTRYGANTNLSALANIAITGVASAQGRTTFPTAPVGLTFPNRNSAGYTTDSHSPTLGGGFGGYDKFYEPEDPGGGTTLSSNVNVGNLASGTYRYNGSNDLVLTAGTVGNAANGDGKNVTIFVEGRDVLIQPNGTQTTLNHATGTWNVFKAPSFTLVVSGGNIYVDYRMTELHGTYVAKSSGSVTNPTGGKIYTCGYLNGTAAAPFPISNPLYYGGCGNQLRVHGSFVANQVNLLRSHGYLSGGPPAEQFLYTPLLYFRNTPDGDSNVGPLRYDAVTSLPPVL